MVEGPGATRNARKLQPAIGYRVVESNVEHVTLVGKVLVEAFAVGKEVFVLFSDDDATCIRLHFGMNGSLYLKRDNVTSKVCFPSYKKEQGVSMQLMLQSLNDDGDTFHVTCFATKICTVSVKLAQSKRDRLAHLDCCAPAETFSTESVIQAIKTRPTAMICDAVLDQYRFPGVGNIIKMEGLHAANVHPKRLVQELSATTLKSLVGECYRYAREWLRSGRAPRKRVYNQTVCGTCNEPNVKMVKMGNDLKRVTFWCNRCQPASDVMAHRENNMAAINKKRTSTSDTVLDNPLKEHRQHCCPQHGIHSVSIKRVRKSPKPENRNRLFACCNVKGCPFFVWADAHLPSCRICKRRSIMRVSKKEISGGRWFLTCPNQSCPGFFAWATPDQLIPFGKHLAPLL